MKADADLIFPTNYLETISKHFQSDPKIGMAGGFVISKKWRLDFRNLTDRPHSGSIKSLPC
jgi:hypothetical protein